MFFLLEDPLQKKKKDQLQAPQNLSLLMTVAVGQQTVTSEAASKMLSLLFSPVLAFSRCLINTNFSSDL